MVKKVKKAAQPSVMESLAAYSPPWEDGAEEKVEADTNKQVQSLTEQLAAMNAKFEAMERANSYRSFQGGTPASAPQSAVVSVDKTVLDLTGMPDPVAETDKYNAEMARRYNEVLEAREAKRQADVAIQNEKAQLGQNLWTGFKSAHPEWAEHEEVVGAVAAQVSQGLAAKGVDVVQMVKQQPELYYKEITGVLDKKYAALKGDSDGEDDGEEPAMVFGGQAGGKGGSLTSAAASMEDSNKAWLKELGDERAKLGLR